MTQLPTQVNVQNPIPAGATQAIGIAGQLDAAQAELALQRLLAEKEADLKQLKLQQDERMFRSQLQQSDEQFQQSQTQQQQQFEQTQEFQGEQAEADRTSREELQAERIAHEERLFDRRVELEKELRKQAAERQSKILEAGAEASEREGEIQLELERNNRQLQAFEAANALLSGNMQNALPEIMDSIRSTASGFDLYSNAISSVASQTIAEVGEGLVMPATVAETGIDPQAGRDGAAGPPTAAFERANEVLSESVARKVVTSFVDQMAAPTGVASEAAGGDPLNEDMRAALKKIMNEAVRSSLTSDSAVKEDAQRKIRKAIDDAKNSGVSLAMLAINIDAFQSALNEGADDVVGRIQGADEEQSNIIKRALRGMKSAVMAAQPTSDEGTQIPFGVAGSMKTLVEDFRRVVAEAVKSQTSVEGILNIVGDDLNGLPKEIRDEVVNSLTLTESTTEASALNKLRVIGGMNLSAEEFDEMLLNDPLLLNKIQEARASLDTTRTSLLGEEAEAARTGARILRETP